MLCLQRVLLRQCVLLLQAFAPLVQRGFLEFVYGGADVGSYCCHHSLVAAVHLTGSEATYNNIMFGSPQVKESSEQRALPASGMDCAGERSISRNILIADHVLVVG
jgi:aldehyde dehydrogenase (NAD(P)+)